MLKRKTNILNAKEAIIKRASWRHKLTVSPAAEAVYQGSYESNSDLAWSCGRQKLQQQALPTLPSP